MIRLDLEPVAYPVLDAEWLPNKKPYPHQVETLRLITEAMERNEFLCIFNASVTGGGKTLASFAYTLRTGTPAVGVYPTNELLEDQRRALQDEFAVHRQLLQKVDSRELDHLELEYDLHGHSRALEMVLGWLNGEVSLLTNPDIVYLTFFGCYAPRDGDEWLRGMNERLHQRLIQNDLFIFDEFHLYNTKQIGNVVTMLGVLHRLQHDRGKVFLFSSATPATQMLELLNKLSIRTETIPSCIVSPDAPNAWTVAHPVELFIVPACLARWQAHEALDEHFTLVSDFVTDRPDARSVFILDSVAGAVQLAKSLADRFGKANVGEVHGLSSEEARNDALRRRFTVGTSTIEVGIDFKGDCEKDLLVFEARTAAQFIQRLGRIGRHKKDSNVPNRAVALVPEYVHNFLREWSGDSTSVSRQQLTELVYEGYRTPNQFRGYLRRYTPVEAHALKGFISHQFQPDDRPRIEESLTQVVEVMSDREAEKIRKQHNWLAAHKMLAPLQSFRGHGLEVALWDKREEVGSPIKTYDLFFILRRGDFKELAPQEFIRRADEWVKRHPHELRATRRQLSMVGREIDDLMGVYGYFELNGILSDARKVWFECYQSDVKEWRKLTTITGLEVTTDDPSRPLVRVNKLLAQKEFVCWLGTEDPFTLNFARGLPPLFELYELRVKGAGGRVVRRGSIAFNQNAYFMDCLRFEDEESTAEEGDGDADA
jgi:CRISPR-associated endonuclease/helicase Cas3